MTLNRFADIAAQDTEGIDLATGALLIAKEEHADLSIPAYLAKLDALAAKVRVRIDRVVGGKAVAAGLNRVLFEEEGFRGNSNDYYNPANSFLNDVLDHRQGIPITLSIIYLEVARRVGVTMEGINFPGHFLVRYTPPKETSLYIDPYHRGRMMGEDGCRAMLRRMYGEDYPLRPETLQGATHRQIWSRMLNNLKAIYVAGEQFDKALRVVNHLLQLNPDSIEELRERGMLYYELECFPQALQDLTAFLKKNRRSADQELLEALVAELRQKATSLQ